MNKKDGGQAFPHDYKDGHWPEHGMSLRDWFAGQALAGLYSSSAKVMQPEMDGIKGIQFVASVAYQIADAMLAERERE